MNFSKVILPLTLFTATSLLANDEISYDNVDFNYADFGTAHSHDDKVYGLDFSFSINDNWYLSLDAERLMVYQKASAPDSLYTKNSFDFSLGFHKGISAKTDFFAELGIEHTKVSVPILVNTVDFTGFENFKISSNDVVGKIGLRTAFNEKLELNISLNTGGKQYPSYQVWSPSRFSDSGYRQTGFSKFNYENINVEVLGLYKFNKNNALKAGYDLVDGFKVGWRYNW